MSLIQGNPDAPILVICDPPSDEMFEAGSVINGPALKMFADHAKANGFSRHDFAFMAPCPPIPEEDTFTEARTNNFLKAHREAFYEALKGCSPSLIITLGSSAAKQISMKAIKVTKARGQGTTYAHLPCPVVHQLSPFHVLRKPEFADLFAADMRMVKAIVKADYAADATSNETKENLYEWRTDIADLVEEVRAGKHKVMSVDTETTGLRWYLPSTQVITVQLGLDDGRSLCCVVSPAYYTRHKMEALIPEQPALNRRQLLNLTNQLKEILENDAVLKCGHNIKFDAHMLRKLGINVYGWFADTQLLAFFTDENMLDKSQDECVRRWVPEMAGYADCVVPDTLILTSDMRKVRAGDLQVGDELCAFTAETDGRKAARRKMQRSTVLATQRLQRETLRITTASGRVTTVSTGHLMLCKKGLGDKGGGWRWRRADSLTVGSVLKPFPWEDPLNTYDAGYAAGVIDGEGWVCRGRSRLGVAQRANVVLDRFRAIVSQAGITAGHSTDSRKTVPVVNDTFDGPECFKVLQVFRPLRLLRDAAWEGCGLPTNGLRHDPVVLIEPAGMQEVVGLKTSTQTIIADGLLSHNSFNQQTDKGDMMSVPPEKLLPYAGGDVDANLRLCQTLTALVRRDGQKSWNCFTKIQMPALGAFMDVVEPHGMDVNPDQLASLQASLDTLEAEMYAELIAEIPASIKRAQIEYFQSKKRKDFDNALKFSRDDFVRDILFTHPDGFKLKPRVFTPGTARLKDESKKIPSVSAKEHLPYFDDIPWVVKFQDYQRIQKLRSTYVGVPACEEVRDENGKVVTPGHSATGFWQYIHNGKIHPSFILHRTVTGRTASNDPNAQNFPKRVKSKAMEEAVRSFRKVFIAPPGYKIVSCDLSQIELRIVAWTANERTMIKLYREGVDIHAATAAATMGLTVEQFNELDPKVKKAKRQMAKAINFGFIYGMWWRKFVSYAKTEYNVDVTDKEAEKFRSDFFRKYPGLEKWHERKREEVRDYGFVEALHGARRHLPSIYSSDKGVQQEAERQAINSPIQRFASDLGLMAIVRLCRDAPLDKIRPIAFIHDDVVCLVKDDYVEEAMSAVRFYMESNPLEEWFGIKPPLPLLAEPAFGDDFADQEERPNQPAIPPEWYDYEADGRDASYVENFVTAR